MRNLTVSFGTVDKAVITAVKSLSWEQLSTALTTEPPEYENKSARGWYIPGTFTNGHRHGDNFVSRDAITLDFDHVPADAWGTVLSILKDSAFAAYTTFSHTYTELRFRVVVPLSRPVSEDEYQAVARKLAERVGIDLVAAESFAPCQMMYLPTRKFAGVFNQFVNPAQNFLDVDKVLEEYDDCTNREEWPRRSSGDDLHAERSEITPPDRKPGLVGDFCRMFRVEAAIKRFDLPYTPTANPNRYTYAHGSVREGVIIYDEGLKIHSHHDTDPCRGQHNAFDLVRLSRFGALDAGRCEGVGPSDWPSYRAMADFVRSLPEFKPSAAGEFIDLSLQSTETDPVGAPGEQGQTTPRFLVQSAADFSDGPPMDWVVRGILPRAELVVIYGESGSGKSFLALDMCAAISRGVDWRDRRTDQGPVVYICAEGAGGFKARLRAYAQGYSVGLHELPAIIADAPNLLDVSDAAELCKAIVSWGKPSVIIIDTLSASLPGGNENSSEDVGRVISHCKTLHRKTGAVVVLIHHSGKDATKGARGWSGLRAAADAEIEITRNGDFRAATIVKMKDGTEGERWDFKLKVIELDALNDEPQSSCIVEHVANAGPQSVVKRKLVGQAKTIYDMLATMAPSGTCALEDLIAGIKKAWPASAGERDTRGQEIKSILKKRLIPEGHVCMHGEDRIGLTNIVQVLDEAEFTEWLK